MTVERPTIETFEPLQRCFDEFNNQLFGGELPQCLILFHRKRSANGYFWGDQFTEIDGSRTVDEISLNPTLMDRGERLVLSTLVHEMVHQWQHHFGSPSRNGYHNREWASKMEQVGLQPSDTGQPGGKRTGQRVTHYIVEGGPFARVFEQLEARGFLKWSAMKQKPIERGPRKQKYSCPNCGLAVWGKGGLEVACIACDVALVVS